VIAAWMVYGLAIGGAVLLAAVAVEGELRSRRRPTRFVWLAALAATVCTTALVVRPERVPVDAEVRTGPSADGAVPGWSFGAVAVLSEPTVIGRVGSSLRRLDRPLLLAWLAGSATVVVLLGGSMVRLSRRRARWQRTRLAGVPVLVTDGIGPAVVGALRPEIAVPRWVLSLDAASQALVLEHEEAHVRARDPQVMLMALAAVALLPWNVAVWWMLLRLRRGIELDCDARVLAAGSAPATYASLLVELCARGGTAPLTAAALVDAKTDLERRVAAILDTDPVSRRRSFARLAGGAALVLVVPVVPRPAVTLAVPGIATPPSAASPSIAPPSLVSPRHVAGAGAATGGVGARLVAGGAGGRGVGAGVGAIGLPFRLDSEIIADLVARHHPDAVAAGAADPPLIVFAFDTSGRVLQTRALPNARADDGVRRTLLELFPELRGRRLRASGSVSGTLVPGSPTRMLRTIYGVFSPD
jgi:BlaR1 peptidase M56